MCNHNPELTARSYPSRSPVLRSQRQNALHLHQHSLCIGCWRITHLQWQRYNNIHRRLDLELQSAASTWFKFSYEQRSGLQNNATGVVFHLHPLSCYLLSLGGGENNGKNWIFMSACFMAASCPRLSMTRTSKSVRGEMICNYSYFLVRCAKCRSKRNSKPTKPITKKNQYLNNKRKPRDSRCCDDIALPWTTRHVHQLCDLRAERWVATKPARPVMWPKRVWYIMMHMTCYIRHTMVVRCYNFHYTILLLQQADPKTPIHVHTSIHPSFRAAQRLGFQTVSSSQLKIQEMTISLVPLSTRTNVHLL